MNDKELQRLFERFSEPILRPCISSAQKEKAIGISKLLWLPLITETDSEQSIYDLLAGLLKDDHNAIIALERHYRSWVTVFLQNETSLDATRAFKARKTLSQTAQPRLSKRLVRSDRFP
ncbi:MAG: hypothetical protein WAN46_03660 [Gammaproteobacteria bacterium]